MPSVRINKELKEGIFFLTFTVKRWYYLFDRHNRGDILLNSLRYCQKNIIATEPNMLKLFEEKGIYHFWQKTNMPELIVNEEFYITKGNYIEQNPVRKDYVKEPGHWVYSSANENACLLAIDSIL